MFQKIEGIVIRTTDYGETNKIVTIFSREFGKVSAMARGAKKPKSRLAAVSQPFTYGYFLLQVGSGLGTLQQGEIVSSFRDIREDIFLTAYASFVVELTDKATEEKRNNPYLFEMLYQTLHHMNEGADAEILSLMYQTKMLPVLGLHPSFDECAICHRLDTFVAFSVREGGFLCASHAEQDSYRIPLNEAAAKLLRLFHHFDLTRLGNISVKPETKKQMRIALNAYFDEHCGIYLKSRRFLNQLDKLTP
ncbi:DNA repair protein RecO [Ectobacillus antri]|uniref:DNA repair protein RecO n=1 Tax=Ectobacillus antri TaxID=2486280 RepID=A0ABT6H1H4_9BACI|nr:DNA repair protein RecO [Ectobacillus antri]MDG4655498.1 DNA repair protein RecO [Ectobacillus antri]MDG5753256.1 DNA repair protein RecO [Ectobacillus antri]